MTTTDRTQFCCPRCDYPLIPVHAVEGQRRRIVAMTCPEPYCDHMQLLPSSERQGARMSSVSRQMRQGLKRAAE